MNLLVMNWQDRENPKAGGAEVHLHETFGRLARRGHRVTLVVSGWPGATERASLDGIELIRVGRRHTYSLVAPLHARRVLSRHRFDLLIEDLNKAPLFSPLWAPVPSLLIVHHLFGSAAFQGASLPVAAATWLLEKPLPRVYGRVPVIAVSSSTRQDLLSRGFRSERVEVVENGVDAARYAPAVEVQPFEEPTILYLGRLVPYKRIDLILDAVAELRRRGTVVRLLVAGQGDHSRSLARHAAKLGLDGNGVEFLGLVSEAEKLDLLRRAWVHVLTSSKEGWGITNLEASACGTAIVASDSPGLRDSVIDGRTGFLVPHGDVDALADRIQRLLKDGGLRKKMGDAGREFALGFSWERAADRFEVLLESAVASRSSGN